MTPRILDPLGIAPNMALKDLTRCLRIAGSAPVETGQAFVSRVCAYGTAPNLASMPDDESALVTALLWIKIVDRMREARAIHTLGSLRAHERNGDGQQE